MMYQKLPLKFLTVFLKSPLLKTNKLKRINFNAQRTLCGVLYVLFIALYVLFIFNKFVYFHQIFCSTQ
jgi:hypothetical protein